MFKINWQNSNAIFDMKILQQNGNIGNEIRKTYSDSTVSVTLASLRIQTHICLKK